MNPMLRDMLVGPLQLIGRTALVGVLAYVSLVLVLRISGKRTLSKLNAFDLVVTVALGSCLATILLSKDTSLLQGITGYLVLVGMQFVVAWSTARSKRAHEAVNSPPTLVFYAGEPLPEALRGERLTDDAVHSAIRTAGIVDARSVAAVVLESNGTLSVLRADSGDQARPPWGKESRIAPCG
jgi:uncharacterized membrane protein YcaP (DUF421 family)